MKGLKYIKENEEKLKIFIVLIEKETLIKKLFEKDNSLLEFICYDLYLFMCVSFKNQILDSTLDKNITNYNTIFSLIKII